MLAIGRDIYLDTRLILSKLEAHFPYPVSTIPDSQIFTPTSTLTLDQRALSYLLARWTASPEISTAAAGCIPTNLPIFEDAKFVKDREELFGRSWKKEDLEKGRAVAVSGMLSAFEFVEGLFGDGRQWILGTKNVSVGDIEGERLFRDLYSRVACGDGELNVCPRFFRSYQTISLAHKHARSSLSCSHLAYAIS